MTTARALLDVLLAALWQDACIAIGVGTVFALVGRRMNATTRFVVLHGLLFTLIAVPLVTTLARASGHEATRAIVLATSLEPATLPPLDVRAPALHVVDVASSDRAVAVVTALWLLVVAAFFLRYAVAALRLSRLLRRSIELGRRDGVRILASHDVAVPLACGFLRPAIVVPTELVSGSGEELECILLHELAHVRRRDAWTNAYERVVQAILFGNPAVAFVLRAIALEREAACDDWAVARSRNVDAYVRSLASFVLRRHARAPVACAVSAFGSATVARLRRLQNGRRNAALTLRRGALGGFGAVLAIVAVAIGGFGPTLALASDQVAVNVPASDPCPKRVQGPPRPPASLPTGLRTDVDISVSASGTVGEPVLVASSGNAGFDRLASRNARLLLIAAGKVSPPRCASPLPGTYHISLETRAADRTLNERHWVYSIKTPRMTNVVILRGPLVFKPLRSARHGAAR